ncbi:MAG: replicative DNA helicase [Pseudomonadota bacterium]
MINSKVPPQNIEAEQHILGACLISLDRMATAIENLTAEDFYREPHKIIFSTMSGLYANSVEPDMVAVADALNNSGKIEQVGGVAYISSLADCIPTKIDHYCKIVKDASVKRRMITELSDIVGKAYNGHDVESLTGALSDAVLSIGSGGKGEPVHISEIVDEAMAEISAQAENKTPVTGISTGLADLDTRMGGLQKSNYVVIAGRPGMGKTSLALKFADQAARDGEGVLIFSMEMKDTRLGKRMLSCASKVSGNSLRTGYVKEAEWAPLTHSAEMLKKSNIYIDDTAALTIAEISARAKKVAIKQPLGLVIVDYIQLSTGSQGDGNRAAELSKISAGLLALAKDLDCSMIVLSQLNRQVENRTDKRPVISDLKESGAIEQDADVVLLLYRDEIYNDSPDNPNKGVAEIIIGKGRDIGNWTVKVGFNGERTEFFDLVWN